jgi:hypothetical protein
MKSAPRHAVVAMYESHAGARLAFNALRDAGLDVNRLTLVGDRLSSGDHDLDLTCVGIPPSRILTYKRDMKSGKFLVLAGGTANVIGQVCAVLGTTGPSRLIAHAA